MPTYAPAFRQRALVSLTESDDPRCERCSTTVTEGMPLTYAPYCSAECLVSEFEDAAFACGEWTVDSDDRIQTLSAHLKGVREVLLSVLMPRRLRAPASRLPRTSAESQTYIDTGELPPAVPGRPERPDWTWTDYTSVCKQCQRTFRASKEAIADIRVGQGWSDEVTDQSIGESLDFCLGCAWGTPVEGEWLAMCCGQEDEHGNASCTGGYVMKVRAKAPGSDEWFTTDWCEDCRLTAKANGYLLAVCVA